MASRYRVQFTVPEQWRTFMRRRLALLVAAGAIAAVPAASAPAADTGRPVAHAACTQARIGSQSRCIARGQFCARAHARDYRKYGLSCTKRDNRGRYHLQ